MVNGVSPDFKAQIAPGPDVRRAEHVVCERDLGDVVRKRSLGVDKTAIDECASWYI
jgi:hypothetical protein